MKNIFSSEIENCLGILTSGGTILFPTDTVWGIGCDATNETAVEKVLEIKQRSQAQGLIILLAVEDELQNFVKLPDDKTIEVIRQQQKPTTIIYEGGKNVASNILPSEKTLAIRIVKDEFCRELIILGNPLFLLRPIFMGNQHHKILMRLMRRLSDRLIM